MLIECFSWFGCGVLFGFGVTLGVILSMLLKPRSEDSKMNAELLELRKKEYELAVRAMDACERNADSLRTVQVWCQENMMFAQLFNK